MKRRHIRVAASVALLAVLWIGFYCWRMAWPRLRQVFEGTPVDVTLPPVEAGFRPGEPRPPGQAPPAEEIVGIGAMLRADNDTGLPLVMSALPGSPAARAGLREGMLLQKVNDTSLEGMPLAECIALIRGPVGTKVRLELRDPQKNAVIPVELIRERVQLGGHR